ncbi:MAG: 50S ribosomal protein L4 [Verrucomicrobia bacterium]|nr:50S ribosomal protein L4 [Verrucomicrobiota bacterium]
MDQGIRVATFRIACAFQAVVLSKPQEALVKAARNLREVDVRPAREVNAEDLLRRRQVWISEEAWAELGRRLQPKAKKENAS